MLLQHYFSLIQFSFYLYRYQTSNLPHSSLDTWWNIYLSHYYNQMFSNWIEIWNRIYVTHFITGRIWSVQGPGPGSVVVFLAEFWKSKSLLLALILGADTLHVLQGLLSLTRHSSSSGVPNPLSTMPPLNIVANATTMTIKDFFQFFRKRHAAHAPTRSYFYWLAEFDVMRYFIIH